METNSKTLCNYYGSLHKQLILLHVSVYFEKDHCVKGGENHIVCLSLLFVKRINFSLELKVLYYWVQGAYFQHGVGHLTVLSISVNSSDTTCDKHRDASPMGSYHRGWHCRSTSEPLRKTHKYIQDWLHHTTMKYKLTYFKWMKPCNQVSHHVYQTQTGKKSQWQHYY